MSHYIMNYSMMHSTSRKVCVYSTLAALIFIQSCGDGTEVVGPKKLASNYCAKNQLDCSSYYPLQVGNYVVWSDRYKNEITGTKVINGKTYFTVSLFRPADLDGNYQEPGDTWYERVENNKLYIKYDFLEDEILWYDFDAEVGSQWAVDYPSPGGSPTVKLISKSQDVTIAGVDFSDAYVMEWRYAGNENYYLYEVILPGIGIAAHDDFTDGIFAAWSIREIQIDGKFYLIEK